MLFFKIVADVYNHNMFNIGHFTDGESYGLRMIVYVFYTPM